MYERVVTKNGDVIWMRIPGAPYGRHDVALMEERLYWRRQRRNAYKNGVEL